MLTSKYIYKVRMKMKKRNVQKCFKSGKIVIIKPYITCTNIFSTETNTTGRTARFKV